MELIMARRKTVNYLSNKVLLKEIHKSKTTFCAFDKPEYADYDLIVEKDVSQISREDIDKAKKNRCNRLNDIVGDRLFAEGKTNKIIDQYILENGVKVEDLLDSDIVVRVMCDDHIPRIKGKKGKIVRAPINFPAFKHYALFNGTWVCVGKSHHDGDKFSTSHGKISRRLAMSYVELVARYGAKGNWRNYTWNEEMRGQALVRLTEVGMTFNEMKSENPFAYFTAVVHHSFTHVLNKEKQHVSTRNKLIAENGYSPTFNEMAEHDIENYMRDQQKPQLVKNDKE